MSYIPNTEADLKAMAKEIGVKSVEDLYSHIPEDVRLKHKLRLPGPMSEMELLTHLEEISGLNSNLHECISFLGAGAYHHFIPAVVGHLAGRAEFYTSYTPYQPEINQGALQAIFEYKTLMCMLTGMEVSNASMYDGASSTAEAVLMALRITGKNRILISGTVHPEYRQVIKTYMNIDKTEIIEIPCNDKGVTDPKKLLEALDGDSAGVVIQSPNFFGIIEELNVYDKIIREGPALFIAAFSDPLAFGLLKPPGDFNADIACGEGQSLGMPPGFGGPYLGILTVKNKHLRNMPGRVVGKTVDVHGDSAYVLTLTAREQHIRRERARSNICTNEGLCALTAAIYLSCLGKSGIKKIARLNYSRSEYAKKQLLGIDGVKLKFESPTFNEFVLQTDRDPVEIVDALSRKNIFAGVSLKKYYRELEDCLLVTVTEMNSVTLQPAAGAHGELTGMLVVKAYFADKMQKRTKVLIPDTAHGTNPASVSMCGFKAVSVKSNKDGIIDKKSVAAAMDEDVAAIMITNPNTLGLFETDIKEISAIVHEKGGLVYGDGANLNAFMGIVSVRETGLDLVHINLHKTFSTPHGGGGPGAGPLAVKKDLSQYLPVPVIKKKDQNYVFDYDIPKSIGKIKIFYGNFLIFVRAYTYIVSMGGSGLKRASKIAVANANYIRSKLKKFYDLPYDTPCLHECVLSDKKQLEYGISTLDIAKRLIDYGFHPPTIYFPLVVNGALMIEPTETESKQKLDLFIDAMISIAREAEHDPQKLKTAPVKSRVGRVDEVLAARSPVLRRSRDID